MDIKVTTTNIPSDAERAAIDAVLGPPASGWDGGARDAAGTDGRVARGGLAAIGERRHLLLPALHAAQDRIGWVSEGALAYICERLTVPPAEAWGVVTFYDLFATSPQPPVVLHVCDDLACRLAGAEERCARLTAALGPEGTPRADGAVTWRRSPCLGQCERAPAALVTAAGASPRAVVRVDAQVDAAIATVVAGGDPSLEASTPTRGADEAAAERIVENRLAAVRASVPDAGATDNRLLARVGRVDPTSLSSYRAHGGYRALARALELGPAGVIAEVAASRLRGRGGAAFPKSRKWEAVANAKARPHYLVCNADESEPGTFKDRILLEHDPFAIVEAMTIAAYTTGCERGYVYLRGEYPLAHARLGAAIAAAREAGLLGPRVMGADFGVELEIRRGAGAYICGEETALFNSLEGRRGEPRSKPPFPVEVGLFGQPTVVNNVETLANVLPILLEGGAAYAATGTAGSTGSRLFCLSGDVARPGLYEVDLGITLGALLDRAGGVRNGRALQAILLGGAAGTFVGPEHLALTLSFEATHEAGATLGSGVVMVFAEGSDLAGALRRIAAFFRHESCGQCVPCRVGTVRQDELLTRLARGAPLGSRGRELDLYRELAQAMRDASICGLGQTACSAIESALARFDPFPAGGHAS